VGANDNIRLLISTISISVRNEIHNETMQDPEYNSMGYVREMIATIIQHHNSVKTEMTPGNEVQTQLV